MSCDATWLLNMWKLPSSHAFEVRTTAGAGRGVFAKKRLNRGEHILTTPGPTAYVVLKDYRKETCSWCFAYDRGRAWKIRKHSVTFCKQDCCDAWVRKYDGSRYKELMTRKLDWDIASFFLSDNGSESLSQLVSNDCVWQTADHLAHEQAWTHLNLDPLRCETLVEKASHNAFGIRPEGDMSEFMGYGVWPEASFFNHSCRPNVQKKRNGRVWVFEAAGEVKEGEELCITYLGGEEDELVVGARSERLNQEWGFRCRCTRCVEEAANGEG